MVFDPTFDENNSELQFHLQATRRRVSTWSLIFTDERFRQWFERDARILRAFHSTGIEGTVVQVDVVEDIIDGKIQKPRSHDEREVFNYNEALAWINDQSSRSAKRLDSNLIRELHSIILEGDMGATPGDYRSEKVNVRHIRTGKIVYRAPPANEVSSLVDQLCDWLDAHIKQGFDPVIAAGIAHLELVAIHPFSDGNGRTARALSTLILQRLGYGFDNLIAIDFEFGIEVARYFDEISQITGPNYVFQDDPRNFTPWLIYFALSVGSAAQRVHDRAVDVQIIRNSLRESAPSSWITPNHVDAIAYCIVRGRIRPSDYRSITGLSRPTVSKHLGQLAEAKLLRARGQTRARVYELHPDIAESIAADRAKKEEDSAEQLELPIRPYQ